jgi:accessory colonization factor AcfC
VKYFSLLLRAWRSAAACALAAGAFLVPTAAGASARAPALTLRAYGPGGPQHVIQECAELYRQITGVAVDVRRAFPGELARGIREDGDLYFGGAEYMLDDFARQHPGLLDLDTVENLHPRRIGIVVRKGNPLAITGVESLDREGVHLLAVRRENMAEFHALLDDQGGNVWRLVHSGQEGVAAWRSLPELDAWVTYKSWHVELKEESEFIELPGAEAVRFTTVALTRRTAHRETARHFVDFLKSPEARQIFVRHGWE